jgi:hypothetical protein
MTYGNRESNDKAKKYEFLIGTGFATVLGLAVIAVLMAGLPRYAIWQQEMAGRAELAKAEQNRQIRVAEAHAHLESAKLEAMAEIERARGAAEANKILGDSLEGKEAYLRYLWIQSLNGDGSQVIYVPTEAGLPVLEAGKRR